MRMLKCILILAGGTHFYHVKYIFCIWILPLLEWKLLELSLRRRHLYLTESTPDRLLASRRIPSLLNVSLLRLFIELNLSCISRQPSQLRGNSERKLSESDLWVRVVTHSSDHRIYLSFGQSVSILAHKLWHESADVLLVQIPILKRIDNWEHGNCIEIGHIFEFTLFNLNFHVIVDFFFEEAGQLKLHIGLKSLTRRNSIVFPLSDLGPQGHICIR